MLGALFAGALAIWAPASVLAQDGASTRQPTSVTVPNFWDFDRRPDPPSGEVGVIRFLTTGDFPPFNFLDSNGELIGFHVDLARAMCDVLNATCTIQMRPFEALIPGLEQRRGDVILAGLAPSPGTREKLDFTQTYLTLPARFVARRGTRISPTPDGMNGQWVSVVDGTAHAYYLLDLFPGARVAAYPDETAARNALMEGVVDAYFGDALSSSFWVNGSTSEDCCRFLGGAFHDDRYFGEGFKMAVARTNATLRTTLEFALHRVAEQGKYAEIFLKYFPYDFY